VFRIERALRVEPGSLSMHLGFLPLDRRHQAPVFEIAIATDPHLDDHARRVLRALYRELTE
jgi:hypothetical protein